MSTSPRKFEMNYHEIRRHFAHFDDFIFWHEIWSQFAQDMLKLFFSKKINNFKINRTFLCKCVNLYFWLSCSCQENEFKMFGFKSKIHPENVWRNGRPPNLGKPEIETKQKSIEISPRTSQWRTKPYHWPTTCHPWWRLCKWQSSCPRLKNASYELTSQLTDEKWTCKSAQINGNLSSWPLGPAKAVIRPIQPISNSIVGLVFTKMKNENHKISEWRRFWRIRSYLREQVRGPNLNISVVKMACRPWPTSSDLMDFKVNLEKSRKRWFWQKSPKR